MLSQTIFFRRTILLVSVFVFFYAAIYFYFQARLGALLLASGLIIFTPLLLILDSKGFFRSARHLFLVSGLYYIYVTPFSIQAPVNIEFYYLAGMFLPMLLFDQKQNKDIFFGILLAPIAWFFEIITTPPTFSDYWVPQNFPLQVFQLINVIGAFFLMFMFISYFSRKQKADSDFHANIERIGNIGGWELDVESQTTRWSPQTYEIHKIDPATPTNKIYGISFYSKEDQPRIEKYLQDCIKNGGSYDDRFQFIDALGQKKWVRATGEAIKNSSGKVYKMTGTFQDITDQVRLENEALFESKKIANFFSTSPDMICVAGTDGYFKELNSSWQSVLGYSLTELKSRPFIEFVHPEDVQATATEAKKLAEGHETVNFTNRYRLKNGNYKHLSWVSRIDPETQLIYAVARDVTQDKRLLENLEDLTQQLANAQKVAKIGSWSFDFNSQRLNWSQQMHALFNVQVSDKGLSQENFISLLHAEDRKSYFEETKEAFQTGREYIIRYRSIWPNRVVWIEERGQPIKNDKGQVIGFYGTCQDINYIIEAEEKSKQEKAKVVHTAKLASLGEMSAAVAHEINNPLAIISASADMLNRHQMDSSVMAKKIESIQKAVARIAKIVNGLRKFSRSTLIKERQSVPLHKIISEVIDLLEAKTKRYEIEIRYSGSEVGVIHCDQLDIEQVFVNLINNAIDAIKDRDEKWIQISVQQKQNSLLVLVEDSGGGIPATIQEKLFLPFFTTKEVGEGTGLGLSIVKGILEDHGAQIEFVPDSANTCFKIEFKSKGAQQSTI